MAKQTHINISSFKFSSRKFSIGNNEWSAEQETADTRVSRDIRTCVAVTSSELVLNNECAPPHTNPRQANIPAHRLETCSPVPLDQMERYDTCFTLHFTVVTDIVIVKPFWSSWWPHKTSSYLVSFWLAFLLQTKA